MGLGAMLLAVLTATPGADGVLPQGPGWHALPDTHLRPWCPSDTQYPDLRGGNGCAGVTAYSGGTFDAVGNRLFILGGGHNDWGGNEVYELDLDTAQLRRINTPSYPVRDGCVNGGTLADGRPVARHTYNHLAFLPESHSIFLYGGSQWQCGYFARDTWTFDPDSNAWTAHPTTIAPRGSFAVSVVRDPVSGLIYARDEQNLYSYDPTSQQWTQRSNNNDLATESYKGAVIDPTRRRYYFYQRGVRTLYSYDISANSGLLSLQQTPAPSCAFMDLDAVGWNYDPDLDRLVAWAGGDTVHLLDPVTATCVTRVFAGGPTALPWIYGRFAYSPVSRVHVACNSIDDDCYILRLDTGDLFANGFE